MANMICTGGQAVSTRVKKRDAIRPALQYAAEQTCVLVLVDVMDVWSGERHKGWYKRHRGNARGVGSLG
jgi:hypothetical protein